MPRSFWWHPVRTRPQSKSTTKLSTLRGYSAAGTETSRSLAYRYRSESKLLQREHRHLIGVVPQSPELTYCRTIDVQRYLNAEILSAGDMEKRRVKSTHLLARTVP